uniref:Zinc finger LSD1-type domain-containing protein n=1 Tax=Oryza punctata TaxID=4537 RepID=A0A0E0JL41_ORYPU
MASSPETPVPPESTTMGSSPLPHSPSPPLQGDPSLPTDAPPEPSPQPHHATPIPPPSPGQATEEWPRAEEPPRSPPPPIDGTPGAADPPPPLFSSLAPPALEAAAAGQPVPPSPPRPPAEPPAEFYPRSAASSPSSSSYETAEDDSPASPPPTPPPLVLCASPDSSYTESPARDRFGEEEGSHAAPEQPPPPSPLESRPDASSAEPAAMASPAREPMGSHTSPEPATPPLEIGQEGFQQQQPHPPPTTHPECDSSEPSELPLPPSSPAEIAHTSPDAAEVHVVAVTPEEAPGSTVAMEVMYREADTSAVSVSTVLESGQPDAAEIDVIAGMQEEVPGSALAMVVTYGDNDTAAVSMSPLLESMEPDAAEVDVVAGVQEEAHGSKFSMEVTYSETDATAVSVSPVLDSVEPDAAKIDVVAGMQEEAPGSMLAMEVTYRETDAAAVSISPVLEHGEPDAAEIDVVARMQEEASGSTLAMEVTYGETDTSAVSVSPVLESGDPDATEIDVVTGMQEEAPGSTLAMEVMYGETDTAAVSVPPVLESGEEGSLQESMQRPSSPAINTEQESMQRPSSPTIDTETSLRSLEMAPPGFENCKVSWLPLAPPTLLGESIPSLPVAATPKALLVMPEEAVESVPLSEALDAEKSASIMQAEPSSPNIPPPGFENFKSSWLPLPTTPPPVETADVLPDVVITKAVKAPIEEVSRPLLALEVTNMESDTVLNILPTEGAEGLLQQALLRPPSPVAQSEPCLQNEMAPPGFENFKSSSEPCSTEEKAPPGSDNFKSSSEPCSPEEMAPPGFENFKSSFEPCSSEEMAPPGFENFKSSWPPLPTMPQTAYALPDAAAADALAATVEEAAGPPPALELEAMDVDMDAIHPPPLPFDSGVESSQKPLSRAPSPIMQEAPCSPDRAPPGFETYKSSQLLLPSPSLAQTTNVRQDQSVTEPVSVTEEAPQPLHSVEVMGAHMDAVPPLLPSSESGADGLSPQQFPQPPPAEKGTTTCLPDMVHSGCDDLEPSQLLPLPAVISPVQTPDGLADVPAVDRVAVASEESPQRPLVSGEMEAGTVPIQSSPLKNASEGSLPQLESESHSPTSQAADSLLDASGSKSVAVASEEMSQPPLALQATTTDLVSTTAMQPQSEGIVDESLQHQHPPSSTVHDAPCLQDSVPLVPPPPSPYLNKEVGQMVCGSCRILLAYFRGAGYVHCTCCQTMNYVLEAHEVGKVHCGHCATLLMYPFGAPAVKCSFCLFVTEIGISDASGWLYELNHYPDRSGMFAVGYQSSNPQELTHQG